jgi:hypothetical protein
MQEGRPERLMTALREYLSTPLEALLQRHLTTSPEEAAVELFQSVAATVPDRANSDGTVDAGLRPEAVEAGPHVECFGPFDLRAQTVVPSAQRTDTPS